jgi:hypothetical protein
MFDKNNTADFQFKQYFVRNITYFNCFSDMFIIFVDETNLKILHFFKDRKKFIKIEQLYYINRNV